MQLKAMDVFAGCGGLTQGLKDAGFDVIAAIEMDSLAAETYSVNHPETTMICDDIRNISAEQILEKYSLRKGELQLLAGCPPCQGFSRIKNKNKRNKLDDPRNKLISEFGRLVEGLLPKVIMLENVPGLKDYSRYNQFLRLLKKLGYDIDQNIINVANYGVPQRRRRLVLLASREGELKMPSSSAVRMTVRDAIGMLPKIDQTDDLLHKESSRRSDRILELIRAIPKDGGSRSALSPGFSLKCHEKVNGFGDVYGRMKWDDVAPTITCGCINPSKGRFLHPVEDRPITLREAALLQTFPKNYIFPLTRGKYAAALMIGNALPPAFAAIQARAIIEHLKEQSEV